MAKKINLGNSNAGKKSANRKVITDISPSDGFSPENLLKFLKSKIKHIVLFFMVAAVILFYFLAYRPMKAKSDSKLNSDMFYSVFNFEDEKYDLALQGDKYHKGFLDAIKANPNCKAADLAHLYAGISFLNKKEYQEAINHLSKFNQKDLILRPLCLSLIGDALSQQGKHSEAVAKYLAASTEKPNKTFTPYLMIKLAIQYAHLGEKEKAINTLSKIVKKYPQSPINATATKLLYSLEPTYKEE